MQQKEASERESVAAMESERRSAMMDQIEPKERRRVICPLAELEVERLGAIDYESTVELEQKYLGVEELKKECDQEHLDRDW